MSTIKKLGTIAAGIFIGLGVLAPTASASESGPQSADCNTWSSGETGYAHCSGLGHLGAHRVKVVCTDTRGIEATFYGSWVANDRTSSKKCPNSSYLLRVGSVIED